MNDMPEIVERTREEIRRAVEVLRSRFPTPATGQIIWWEMAGFVEIRQSSPTHKEFLLFHLDGKPFGRTPFSFSVGYGPTSPWLYIAADKAEYDDLIAKDEEPPPIRTYAEFVALTQKIWENRASARQQPTIPTQEGEQA